MTQKVEKLTEAQIARFDEFVDKWVAIGLNTDPVDFEAAKAAVQKVYKEAGLVVPDKYFVAKSPKDAVRIIQELDPSLSERDIMNEMMFGNYEASWLSFYDFFYEVVGVEEIKKLEGFFELAKSSGWVSCYDEAVVFQDRPERIKLDDQHRLHCEDGPALLYRDGLAVYAWHGTRIPRDWIEDKANLSAKTALTWENIEERRCACEILGWSKILSELDAKIIDADEDAEIGTLVEVEIPDVGTERFLKVLCGTKREFALPVPPEMKTALEANAWTFGFDTFEFKKPEVRT